MKNLDDLVEINLDQREPRSTELNKNLFFSISINKVNLLRKFKNVTRKKMYYLIIKLKKNNFLDLLKIIGFILSNKVRDKNFLIYFNNKKQRLAFNIIPDWPKPILGKNFLICLYSWLKSYLKIFFNTKNIKYLIFKVIV